MEQKGTLTVKRGLAQMLKGGVIMDVVTPEQAVIAQEAGAVAVMALERIPADIRAMGGVARMSNLELIRSIMDAVTIPVMAKVRIGHIAEAQVLQALGVDFIDESEVLTPADDKFHLAKNDYTTPFVCGARDLGEALRRIAEGAAMIRSKGEAGSGNIVEAVRHMRAIGDGIRELTVAPKEELVSRARDLGAPLALLPFIALHAAGVDASALVKAALAPLAHLGDSYPALLAIVFVETALWCVGIHGPALLAGVVTPVYLSLQAENTHAFAAHQPLPHIVVVSLFLFVFPGGAGATLPLAALLARSKIPRLHRIGRATLPFALINANEPLLFTLPIVANPFLALPFIGIPMLLASITYAAITAGWVARAAFYVPSSIPAPLSVYLATLDWRAPILLLVNLLVATLLWLPAVRAYERHEVGLT